jgi:tRNA(fMet)-specific endonuclease VapC
VLALDTNTVVHLFRGLGQVPQNFLRESPGDIFLPAVVLYELEVGVPRAPRPQQRREDIDSLMAAVRLLAFDDRAARAAAEVRVELERAGIGIGPIDNLIAGTALAYSATLVTHNTKEFSRVRGLRIVDWY